ncbi:MAG: hypothetical protein AVDCRST_MAG15-2013, partial [uncultured Rubellimicrobium sp.]
DRQPGLRRPAAPRKQRGHSRNCACRATDREPARHPRHPAHQVPRDEALRDRSTGGPRRRSGK